MASREPINAPVKLISITFAIHLMTFRALGLAFQNQHY